jgi:preprotein translocase subunit SecA
VSNPFLKAQLIEVVNNQLRDNDPKATKESFNRLVQLGYKEDKAKEMIAAVLIEEMYGLLKNNETYNEERYTRKLAMLPECLTEREDTEENDLDDKEFDEANSLSVEPYVLSELKVGRNEPCPCGSGKKYKKCCGK